MAVYNNYIYFTYTHPNGVICYVEFGGTFHIHPLLHPDTLMAAEKELMRLPRVDYVRFGKIHLTYSSYLTRDEHLESDMDTIIEILERTDTFIKVKERILK